MSKLRTIALLALTAAIIVAQEVLVTRLLSVTTWYSMAFVVLNLAMLGLTAGSLQAARAERLRKPFEPWLASRMLALSAGLLAADLVTVITPLEFELELGAFAAVLLVVAVNTIPMVAGGAVIARLMSRGAAPVPTLYAFDLVAAALGALAPLALLGPLSAPHATALLASVAAAGSLLAARGRARALAAIFIVLPLVAAASGLLTVNHAKGTNFRALERPVDERWNALAYVYSTAFVPRDYPPMWQSRPGFEARGVYPTSVIRIDGDASTPVHAYRDPSELTFLRYDGVFTAHALRPSGTACVIGAGGGRDVVAALHFGHDRVLAIEINPAIVAMLRKMSDVSPVARDPRVELVVGDGRAVLSRRTVQCSVLQASLIDTWAATSAGAFAHTEATLYTREAWALFLRRVEPRGILTVSRWYDPNRVNETARMISLATAALIDRGVRNPRAHIAVIASKRCATLLVSPEPFSEQDRALLAQFEPLLVAPWRRASDPLLDELLDATSIDALESAGVPYGLDTSAPTDARPFFFQLIAPTAWLHPGETLRMLRTASSSVGGVAAGNVAAMVGMVLMLSAVTLVGAVLLGPTLVRSLRSESPPLPGARAWVYFGALGAGFMLAELALMQRMHVILGHPTYSLVVVLASLLVATGIGSALSTRIVRSRRAVSVAAVAAGLVLALLPLVIAPLARVTGDAPLLVRAMWTGSCAAVVGLLLGMMFPSGLRFASREEGAPAALAVNGVTSVLGGGAAVMVSVALGIPASFALAGVCYLVAALAGPAKWRVA